MIRTYNRVHNGALQQVVSLCCMSDCCIINRDPPTLLVVAEVSIDYFLGMYAWEGFGQGLPLTITGPTFYVPFLRWGTEADLHDEALHGPKGGDGVTS